MAGSFANFLENELLDHVFGNASYSAPANIWVALYTVAPTDAGGGTEADYTGYARVQVTNNATNFPAASAGSKSNGTAVTFGTNTGTSTDTIVAGALLDASTGGNFLVWGDLTATKTIATNDIPKINVSGITITLD